MKFLTLLNKPEYFYRPKLIIKKIWGQALTSGDKICTLSWGGRISIRPTENIGKSILNTQIYDLAVTEAIYRLCKEGDTVIDAGANIGYTSLLMLHRIGITGKLLAFEPHPYIFKKLESNIRLNNYKNHKLYNIGLSNQSGKAKLIIPNYFNENEGVSFIADDDSNNTESIEIDIKQLDEIIEGSQNIKLLKIDVEGHELKVLEGAKKLLSKQLIENVLFECNHENKIIVEFLESFGYMVYRLDKTFAKIKLSLPTSKNKNPSWEPINYLATHKAPEIKELFHRLGYLSL